MSIDKQQFKELMNLDTVFNTIQDVDILLEKILYEARKLLNADAGSLYIKEGQKLKIKYAQNSSLEKKLQPGHKLIYSIFEVDINKNTISGYTAITGEPINIRDVYQLTNTPYSYDASYDKLSGYKTISMLSIPLKSSTGETLGVIQIINKKDQKQNIISFDQEDELLALHFANDASIALERAKMTRAIILRMIKMAELRDPKETGMHVNRVGAYSVELYERYATKKNVDKKEIQKNKDILRMSAMLHDVGKIGISDSILKKPARLSSEEYEIMKTHSYIGAHLFLDKDSEFDEMALVIALNHHEKWDGTGYPGHINIFDQDLLNLSSESKPYPKLGEEIPLWGRIVAIADVFDALSSKRVYKEAWNEEEVLNEIQKLRGTHFDPELTDIFFEVLPNLKQISQHFQDPD